MNARLRTSHERCWPSPSAKTSVSYQSRRSSIEPAMSAGVPAPAVSAHARA